MNDKKAFEIFVDPVGGRDTDPGNFEQPFRTLERAVAYVRSAGPSLDRDLTVYLRGGVHRPEAQTREVPLFDLFGGPARTYPLRVSSLRLDADATPAPGCTVRFRSYPGERAVISGGRTIAGWEPVGGAEGLYRAPVGAGVDTRQLYVSGRRATRARSQGGLGPGTVYDPECHRSGGPAYVTEDDAPLRWSQPQEVEFVYPSSFTMSRCGVDRVEKRDGKTLIYMKQPGWYYVTHKYGTSVRYPAWIENARELLDTPGEWYLDRTEGYIYYMPLPGERMEEVEAVIPVVDVLLQVKGSDVARKAARFEFHELDFLYAGWLRPNGVNGHCDCQNNYIRESYGREYDSDHQSDAAIELEYADGIVFEGCRFAHLGITAIRMTKACQGNTIQGCELFDVSGGGISIGDPEFRNPESRGNYWPESEAEMLADNRIMNNYIHDIGVEFMSATAISATYTKGTEIAHNDICRVPYSAVHIGFGWEDIAASYTQGLKLHHNVIDTFMMRLFDGGGMYFLGATAGSALHSNEIKYNVIRNQVEPKYGGLYFDEGSSHWHAESNVFEHTELWCNISGISRKLKQVTVTKTYLTGGYAYYNPGLGQEGVAIEPPVLCPNRDWPPEAEAIWREAGLTGAYARLRPDYDELGDVWLSPAYMELEANETARLEPNVRTVRGVRIDDVPEHAVRYRSADPAIAEVDGSGYVRGVSQGRCRIEVEVTLRGVAKRTAVDVYVQDQPAEATVHASSIRLLPHDRRPLLVTGVTRLGRPFSTSHASWSSSRPEVVAVGDDGVATALSPGWATITAKLATREGGALEACASLEVCAEPSGSLIRDAVFWRASGDMTIESGGRFVKLSTPGGLGTAVYAGRAYGDERIVFELRLESEAHELVCLHLRSKRPEGRTFDPGGEGYVVVLRPQEIELHRFRDMQRTVLYGSLFGFQALGGQAIPNAYVRSGEACRIELEAAGTPEGVRLRMTANGETVFDYKDREPERIGRPGYFGVTVTKGSIELREAEE